MLCSPETVLSHNKWLLIERGISRVANFQEPAWAVCGKDSTFPSPQLYLVNVFIYGCLLFCDYKSSYCHFHSRIHHSKQPKSVFPKHSCSYLPQNKFLFKNRVFYPWTISWISHKSAVLMPLSTTFSHALYLNRMCLCIWVTMCVHNEYTCTDRYGHISKLPGDKQNYSANLSSSF